MEVCNAQTIRLEGNTGSRTVGGGIINHYAGPERTGVCSEAPFSGQFSSVKALFPTLGAAVLARELAGLPWSAINLSKLKLHATGKGTPGSQRCRLPGRRVDLKDDKADVRWMATSSVEASVRRPGENVALNVTLAPFQPETDARASIVT